MSRLVQMHQSQGTREELEPAVLALAADEPVFYLGIQGPTRAGTSGDDPWPVHTWRIGEAESAVNPDYVPQLKAEAKHRQDTAIFRREVWPGSGEPVGDVVMPPRAEPEIVLAFPEPVVPATVAEEFIARAPAVVNDLEAYAVAQGWDIMITYAKGWVPHASWGTPNKGDARESWGVRMRRGAFRATAVRMNGSWASMWTWSDTDFFVHHKTLGAFQEAIR
jgi:hypothetical protein